MPYAIERAGDRYRLVAVRRRYGRMRVRQEERASAGFREDQARDEHGRWVDEGGGNTDTGGHYSPRDREAFHYLKQRWARVNNSLLKYADQPNHPAVNARMNQLKSIVKEMYRLNADPGGLEGLGLPGGARDMVVIGAGPGGLAAGIMGGTDGLDTLILDAQDTPGGQAKYSSRIENYPGFPVGTTGQNLTKQMYEQAQRVGADTKLGVRVTGLTYDDKTGLKTLTLSNGETVTARAVVLAGGVEFRRMDLPGFDARNVTYGDGEALAKMSFGKTAVVVGGSNGAAQAALGVARAADRVYVVSRSPIDKSMSDYQVQALRHHDRITVIEGDSVSGAVTDSGGEVRRVTTKNGQTIDCGAVGVFIGGASDTGWLPESVKRDAGKVSVDGDLQTTMPGVFAVGDVRSGSIGRIGAAVGDGQMATRNVWRYYETLKNQTQEATRAAESTLRAAEASVADAKAWDRLVNQLFALDAKHPFLGQSVDGDEDEPRLAAGYDESQPRDENGRWVGGGGGGAATGQYDSFKAQALSNLSKSSRTSTGVSDTSSSADKPKLNTEGEKLATITRANTEKALEKVWQARDRDFTAFRAQQFIEDIGRTVNDGLGGGPLYRQHETKFERQTKSADVRKETREFAAEFAERLDDPDPVATAAWVEYEFDGRIHPFSDGVGRSAKMLSALVLARHGVDLPRYADRKSYYENINKPLDEFTSYYRSLFPKSTPRHAYSEDQPRDELGRWTDTDGSGSVVAGPESKVAVVGEAVVAEAGRRLGVSPEAIKTEAAAVRAAATTPAEITHAESIALANLSAREGLKSGDTKRQYTDNEGRYTPERVEVHKQVVQKILAEHVKRYGRLPEMGLDEPTVTFLCGLPGAGKSTAVAGMDKSNALVADPDGVKELLPEWNGFNAATLARESGDIADMVMAYAYEKRMNLVIDGTAKTSGSPGQVPTLSDGLLGKLAAFKDNGFKTDVRFVDVTIEQSVTRAVDRFVGNLQKYADSGYDPLKAPRWVELDFIKKMMRDDDYGNKSRRSFELAKKYAPLDTYTHVNGWTGEVVDTK